MRREFSTLSAGVFFFAGVATAVAAPQDDRGPGDGAQTAPDPYVVGGSVVPDGMWPDAALLLENGQPICTGTLIAPSVVLTAGHCLEGAITSVKLGVVNINEQGEEIAVQTQIEYPNSQTTYDVGLLLLASPAATEPRAVADRCVVEDHLRDGAEIIYVGFGAIDTAGTQYTDDKRMATDAVEDHDCSDGDGCVAAISPGGELVSVGSGVNPCYGDSGGPLYLPTPAGAYVVGVVSRGVDSATADCAGGGIFPRVDAILPWIEEQTGQSFGSQDCSGGPGTTDPDPDDPSDPDEPGEPNDPGTGPGGDSSGGSQAVGGCAVGGDAGSLSWLLLALGITLTLRRRR